MFELQYNKIQVGTDRFQFSREIIQAVQLQDTVIVLLDFTFDEDCINNIYALKNGRILWQIQDQRHYKPILFECTRVISTYTMVSIYDKDSRLLVATDSMGYRYLIDPTSGLIVGQDGWTK